MTDEPHSKSEARRLAVQSEIYQKSLYAAGNANVERNRLLARLESLETVLDKAKAWLEACDTWDVGHAKAREAFRKALEGLK